ncbi:MAG: hypothetical protein V1913_09795, partial [Fibrobacterota bacterium]
MKGFVMRCLACAISLALMTGCVGTLQNNPGASQKSLAFREPPQEYAIPGLFLRVSEFNLKTEPISLWPMVRTIEKKYQSDNKLSLLLENNSFQKIGDLWGRKDSTGFSIYQL